MGKYKEKILKLRLEGKKYKEIATILNCTISIISYHLTYHKVLLNKLKDVEFSSQYNKKQYQFSNKYKQRNREIVTNYLKTHPCIDCGNSDIRVLEFDHVRGIKIKEVAKGVKDSWPTKKLLEEIDKCEVRCANCHRIVTRDRQSSKSI